jgi:hypothetical protein
MLIPAIRNTRPQGVRSGQRGLPLKIAERETEAMIGASAWAANYTRVWPAATTVLTERAAGEAAADARVTTFGPLVLDPGEQVR